MIIDIKQTKSNMAIKFEMFENKQIVNYATCSRLSSVLAIELFDKNNNLIFKSNSNIKNRLISSIPFISLMGKKEFQKSLLFNTLEEKVGEIFLFREAFLNTYYVVNMGDVILKIYTKSKGVEKFFSIYRDGSQIGMIVKNSKITNNLDYYRIYLIDEHDELSDLLKIFALYIDNELYSERNEVVSHKKEVSYEYTYSKTDKYYNPEWLEKNFGVEA